MSRYERISKLAHNKNLSISKLEMKLGFGNGTIKKWDYTAPSSERLYELADFFDVDPRYILKDEIKDYNIPDELRVLLDNFLILPTEKQDFIKSMTASLAHDVNQEKLEKKNLEQSIRAEEKKAIILELLNKKMDDDLIQEVTKITSEELEMIKQSIKSKKKSTYKY